MVCLKGYRIGGIVAIYIRLYDKYILKYLLGNDQFKFDNF